MLVHKSAELRVRGLCEVGKFLLDYLTPSEEDSYRRNFFVCH
jgi:hypothetical protein